MKCLIKDCKNVAISKGYCDKHYRRLKKYGDPSIVNTNKGKTYEELYGNRSDEIKHKMSKSMKGKLIGINNPSWKGDDVGYWGVHYWIKKYKRKPKKCSHCKKVKRLVLANKSGKYKRILSDWIYICYKCHMKFDGLVKPKPKCFICNKEVSRVRNVCCSRKCRGIYQKTNSKRVLLIGKSNGLKKLKIKISVT